MTTTETPADTPADTRSPDQIAFDSVSVGDVFHSSWGYDQTNVDFYKVVAKTKARIKVVEIGKMVDAAGHASTTYVRPDKRVEVGKVMTKVVKDGYRGQPYFRIASYALAFRWDGTRKHETALGWGH